MNAFHVKVIAIIAMLVDHFALFFFPESVPLQVIGRISFPLIAWLIANGAIHTKNIDLYALRLILFAVLAQFPYELGFLVRGEHPLFLNVLFTLAFGLLAIRHLRSRHSQTLKVLGVGAFILLPYILNADYGALGVVSILAFYLLYRYPFASVGVQAFIYIVLANVGNSFPDLARLFNMHPVQEYAVVALPLILLYNGKRGLATHYFFYWFFVVQAFVYLFLSILVTR